MSEREDKPVPAKKNKKRIRRELREEIGVEVVSPGHAFFTGIFSRAYPNSGQVEVTFFRVRRWTGEPRPLEGQPGAGWFLPKEMLGLELTPGNRAYADKVAREIEEETLNRQALETVLGHTRFTR